MSHSTNETSVQYALGGMVVMTSPKRSSLTRTRRTSRMCLALFTLLVLSQASCLVPAQSSFAFGLNQPPATLWVDDTSDGTIARIENLPVDDTVQKAKEILAKRVPLAEWRVPVAERLMDGFWNAVKKIANLTLGKDSAKAVTMIVDILSKIEDYGVVDLRKYGPNVFVTSTLALSRLQLASLSYAEQYRPGQEVHELALLKALEHYAPFASVAYGWFIHNLLFPGRIYDNNRQALLSETGIDANSILAESWDNDPHYFLVRDTRRRKLVLTIRGTADPQDVLTDLCATEAGEYRAHAGMVEYANDVKVMTEERIASELKAYPDYSLVLVGHSLGGGVAALLGSEWEDKFHGVTVYAYGCPCVAPIDTKPTRRNSTLSVVNAGDPVGCLSLGHVADVTSVIAQICDNKALRYEIFRRTDEQGNGFDPKWCYDTMEKLRDDATVNMRAEMRKKAEKMYPSGRVFRASPATLDHDKPGSIAMREVPNDFFRDFLLPYILSLPLHFPSVYEAYLRELVETDAI